MFRLTEMQLPSEASPRLTAYVEWKLKENREILEFLNKAAKVELKSFGLFEGKTALMFSNAEKKLTLGLFTETKGLMVNLYLLFDNLMADPKMRKNLDTLLGTKNLIDLEVLLCGQYRNMLYMKTTIPLIEEGKKYLETVDPEQLKQLGLTCIA